jgi:hypothetical protein
MPCDCNRPRGKRFTHRVISGTDGTNFALITTNSDNINDRDPYFFTANQCFIQNLPTTPLPVTVLVNGTQVPVWDKYDAQILSSAIPKDAVGVYTEEQTPHVSLNDTPETVTIP